ncbi:MAG: hypothetical protein ACK5MI_05435 [Mangrovibacterium sp.]
MDTKELLEELQKDIADLFVLNERMAKRYEPKKFQVDRARQKAKSLLLAYDELSEMLGYDLAEKHLQFEVQLLSDKTEQEPLTAEPMPLAKLTIFQQDKASAESEVVAKVKVEKHQPEQKIEPKNESALRLTIDEPQAQAILPEEQNDEPEELLSFGNMDLIDNNSEIEEPQFDEESDEPEVLLDLSLAAEEPESKPEITEITNSENDIKISAQNESEKTDGLSKEEEVAKEEEKIVAPNDISDEPKPETELDNQNLSEVSNTPIAAAPIPDEMKLEYELDSYQEHVKSLENLLHAANQADKQQMPTKKLIEVIGLNERFEFIADLFENRTGLFYHAVQAIDQLNSYNEAVDLIERNFDWPDSEIRKQFMNLVQRRFA